MSKPTEIRNISDLPYFKEEHEEILKDMGIKNLDDLLDTLYDDELCKELTGKLKGVGPKIVEQWIELIEDHGVFEEEDLEEEEATEIEEPEVVEEGGYFAAPKPELDDETRRLFELRKSTKLPKFRRQEWFRYKKLGEKYRRPKGIHSKMRRRYRYRSPMASVGYKTPVKVRNLHSSGFQEILVHNPTQLEGIDPKTQAARVGHTVGYKKRLDIEKKASELGIHILNRTGY